MSTMTRSRGSLDHEDHSVLATGTLAGAVAGVMFLVFKMSAAVILGDEAMATLRSIAAMALGEEALAPEYSAITAAFVGTGIHMALSLIYGVIFAIIVSASPMVARSRPIIALAGIVSGLLLWVVNLYLFAPLLFPWFSENEPLVEIAARTVFFGLPLALFWSQLQQQHRTTSQRSH